MPGRPKGSKNKEGHNAGGARPGAGRKRKEEMSDPQKASKLLATKVLKRLTGDPSFEMIDHFTITKPDGRAQHIDLNTLPPFDLTLLSADVLKDEEGAQTPLSAYPTAPLLGGGGPEAGPSDSAGVPLAPAVEQTPEAGQSMDDLVKLFTGKSQDPATSARLSLLTDPRISHQAIQQGLRMGASVPESLTPVENPKPTFVTGPFLVTPLMTDEPEPNMNNLPPSLYGPVDEALLPTEHCTAVYYVVYEKLSMQVQQAVDDAAAAAASPSIKAETQSPVPPSAQQPLAQPYKTMTKSSGPRTGPGAPIAGPSLSTVLSGEVDAVPWPVGIDLTGRKRAPRRCLICGDFECKGRGGRQYCPKYEPNNPEHQLNGAGQRKVKRDNEGSPIAPDLMSPGVLMATPPPPLPSGDYIPADHEGFPLHPSLVSEMKQPVDVEEPPAKRVKVEEAEEADPLIDPSLA